MTLLARFPERFLYQIGLFTYSIVQSKINMKHMNGALISPSSFKIKGFKHPKFNTFTTSKCPPKAALYKGVRWKWPMEFMSAPSSKRNVTVSTSPPAHASDNGLKSKTILNTNLLARYQSLSYIWHECVCSS